ncbi:Serine/threonine protein kinase [Thermococcus sp. 4557]|nr:Serine/threonine protein kinase [Thermococcus sp. 4557]
MIKGVDKTLAKKAKNLLDATKTEIFTTLNVIIKEFNTALENLDIKTAEAKLKEAEPYAEALGKNINWHKKRLEKVKEVYHALEEAQFLLSKDELVQAYSKFKRALSEAQSLNHELLMKKAGEGLKRIEEYYTKESSKKISNARKLADDRKYSSALIELKELLPLARAIGRSGEIERLMDEIQVDSLLEEADSAFKNSAYVIALGKYRKAYSKALKLNQPEKANLAEKRIFEIEKHLSDKLLKQAENAPMNEAIEKAKKALEIAGYLEDIRIRAQRILSKAENELSKILSEGDALLLERRFDDAIRVYESALPLAEAIGKSRLVSKKIEHAKALRDRESQIERLNSMLSRVDELMDRKEYSRAVIVINESLNIAKALGMIGRVQEKLESLKTRMENLVSRGDSAFESGDYTEALKLYDEALRIAEAMHVDPSRIKGRIMRVEERQRLELLKESLKLDVPTEMPHKVETEVSIIVTNRFSEDLSLTVDLSENVDYFELSEEKVNFPRVKPGRTIGESITVKPRFMGDFDFIITVESDKGSFRRVIPVKVTKTARMGAAAVTPSALTSIPIINPVEALQELYSDFQYIGEGGFARVYRAKRKDGKTVALKIPKTLDPAVGRAFVREITNWLHLKHPNIVELYDVNVLPVPYLEMEYCESSLARVQKPLPVDEASLIVFNIAEALKYAHGKKIVHRDLKPSNVLLKNGLPKISDWGLSKVLEESMSTTTTTSFTPFYAAPEQIDKKYGHTEERTDIYQLGVIFYELVTGKLPFEGTLSQVMMGILRDDPVPPSQLNPAAREVEQIIMRMLAKRKEDRYQSIEELQRDLARVLNMTYSESLKESKTLGDVGRAKYYLTELLLINLKTNNAREAYKYASDLAFYVKGELKEEVQKLAEQVKFRLEEGLDIPQELIEKAEIVVHKIRVGFEKV